MANQSTFARVALGIWRWTLRLLVLAVLIFVGLMILWRFAPPVSTLMMARYVTFKPVERTFVPLSEISIHLRTAVITSEDGQFCRHRGVDWGALREVLKDEDGPSRGASTIPMQVVKNLFLWPSRSALRKGLEIPMAILLDFGWDKRHVLEAYLNIAEWGDGIFGAEAASRRYFRKSAAALTPAEAALLAVALPNPIIRNTARPSSLHRRLAQRLQNRMALLGAFSDCVR